MALVDKVCRSLLAALVIATVASCGESAEPSAAFRRATAADPSPSKAGDPAGALPSHVVSGEVATFEATSTKPGTAKSRDTAGSLPTSSAEGKSAVYDPGRGRGPTASRTPPAAMAKP